MGIGLGSRCSSPYAAEDSNPNPVNFRITKEERIGKFLLLIVNYPDAKNFEGDKILVYEDVKDSIELLKMLDNKLDPHFSKQTKSPVARFPPTKEGYAQAYRILTMLDYYENKNED